MTEVLASLSDALALTVAKAGSSVVRVEGRRRLPASGIVWSADGVVVTAHHVVQREENISLGLPDGKTVSATLVGRDPTTDLAVLRAETTKLAAPTWAELDSLQVGHLVLALGRPGQSVQATLGIVSALSGTSWRTPVGGQLDRYLQTDVVMYPGFSGGPLVSATGQVIGLNTSALLRGVSLTVPAPTVRRIVETLLEHGRVRRGYLGVSTQSVRLPAVVADQVNQETGLLVVSVEPDSPADRGGLILGDTIVTLADNPVRHYDDLLAQLSPDRVGKTIPVRIVRGGQVEQITLTVGERQ
jgi:S1-C subfamily serine protease